MLLAFCARLLTFVFAVLDDADKSSITNREVCRDESGVAHALGSNWLAGQKMCSCIYPESLLYFWEGKNPSAPIAYCQIDGCPDPAGGLLKNGQTFARRGGDTCTCIEGSNPGLMDASTRYHARCVRSRSGKPPYYIDFEDEE